MSTLYENLRQLALPYETKVKTLLNSDLKTICKEEGLQVSGVKATLQGRVLERINDAIESGDTPRLHEILRRINRFGNHAGVLPSNDQTIQALSAPAPVHSQYLPFPPNQQYSSATTTRVMPPQQTINIQSLFKSSPFYAIHDQVTPINHLPIVHSSTRYATPISFRLSPAQNLKVASDSSLRLMLYCYVEHEPSPRHITFPNAVEIKVNGELFQGNLRGVKKKQGTTKPADIHSLVRLAPNATNHVSLVCSATDKYSFVICIVKKTTVDELTDRIKKGHSISKQSVINEMISKAKDPDIVATSTVMSLKCPLSATRMTLPCRSSICSHNQCFDATSFLQLQEQAPQWSCPICNKAFGFEALVVDQFVQDILNTVSKSTEQITIEPNGSWKQETQPAEDFRMPSSTAKRKHGESLDLDGSSPIEQAVDYRVNGIRAESVSTPQSCTRTPTFSSREPSTSASTTAPRSAGTGSKRRAEEVIDLTLSDEDEDEPPRRPGKRQSTGHALAATHSPIPPMQAPEYSHANLLPMHSFPNGSYASTNQRAPSHQQRPISIAMPQRPPSVATPQQSPGFSNGSPYAFGYGNW